MSLPVLVIPEQRRDWVSLAKNAPATKCRGCGSLEFRTHHGKRICAYCRSEVMA